MGNVEKPPIAPIKSPLMGNIAANPLQDKPLSTPLSSEPQRALTSELYL